VQRIVLSLLLCIFVTCAAGSGSGPGPNPSPKPSPAKPTGKTSMRLGNFSVSLAVKDLKASREFYNKLGFRVVFGNDRDYSILQNESATIGLFQGMFDKNVLTFNPGWDRTGSTLPDFDDVRDIQRTLVSRGVALKTKADESTTGPASMVLFDPDGNQIVIDQHVPAPHK
jgi:catechol 2,3-dioxygenase-like lactoylglutathione lyase family enzyme